jgi:hypothetical protein
MTTKVTKMPQKILISFFYDNFFGVWLKKNCRKSLHVIRVFVLNWMSVMGANVRHFAKIIS